MDIRCPRCGGTATPAGHEDARTIYRCEICNRVWMSYVGAPHAAAAGPRRTRVLVVDDSDQLVALLASWLEDEGYLVSTATSGASAMAAAATESPDIVLLDLILPPPDGFTVAEALQRRSQPPLIVVMTGVSDPLRLRRIEETRVFAVLPKPLTQEVVLDAVSRADRARLAQRGGAATYAR
jgi:CheY-like chemotaxis protein